VGQWRTTSLQAQVDKVTEQGGAGITLHIDPDGNLTMVFDGMAPVALSGGTASTPIAGTLTYAGTVTESLTLPPPDQTSGGPIPARSADVSKLTATVHLTKPVAITYGPINVLQLAKEVSGIGGIVNGQPIVSDNWRCTGDTIVTTSASSNVSSTWTLARTGAG
jgi:hypothetical protein